MLEFFRVDPKTRAAFVAWRARGIVPGDDAGAGSDRTIIFSSHLLGDIERMADHIAVLDYCVLARESPDRAGRRDRDARRKRLARARDLPGLPKTAAD